MSKLVVGGSAKLDGEVTVGGSKNASLPILAATLLATKPVTLHRVPAISDVAVMLDILRGFGMKVEGESGTVTLDPTGIKASAVPDELARSLRASILMLGPAIARFGEYASVHPGGDLIGRRPLDTHFRALETLGASVEHDHARYTVTGKDLAGTTVFLEEASVTATENLMMAATAAPGTTVIKNAASELHVRDLAHFLTKLGAKISGAGTNKVTVEGGAPLGAAEHEVRADEIETGTFMMAAALCGGEVAIKQVDLEHFGSIPLKLREAGVNFTATDTEVVVKGPHQLRGNDMKVEFWPGFPTDLQPPYTVMMTQADGMSLIHDHMYEGRFFYTDKLVSMGANITMADPHRIIVSGPTKLRGKELESPDIRAGITLLVAALVAEGETTIDHAELIDRGYERIDERLRDLGASVTRVEESPTA